MRFGTEGKAASGYGRCPIENNIKIYFIPRLVA